MQIKVIELDQVWRLRQEILWPDRPLSFSQVTGDESAQHFGVWADGDWRAVVSVFETNEGCQLRKLGTQESYRRRGFGRELVQHVLNWCSEKNTAEVFLDARIHQVSWYEHGGWVKKGKPFQKYEKAYQRMVYTL